MLSLLRTDEILLSLIRFFPDYIFVLLPPGRTLKVPGILEPPLEEELGTGLPRHGVCGSDHISVRARVGWPRQDSVDSKT